MILCVGKGVCVCAQNEEMYTHACTDTHTHTHTPLFDPELALQLPETQQKTSSIHCMSCVFPRRARAQLEKGPRSLSPDMDVYSLYGPAEHPQKGWPSHFDVHDT